MVSPKVKESPKLTGPEMDVEDSNIISAQVIRLTPFTALDLLPIRALANAPASVPSGTFSAAGM